MFEDVNLTKHVVQKKNISSIVSRNSEAFTSVFLDNLEGTLLQIMVHEELFCPFFIIINL